MKIFSIKPWIIGIIIILSIIIPIHLGINMVDSLGKDMNGITLDFYKKYSSISLIIPLFYLIWLLYIAIGIYWIEKIKYGDSKILIFISFWVLLFLSMIVFPLFVKDYESLVLSQSNLIIKSVIIISLGFNLNYIIRKIIFLESERKPRLTDYFNLILYLLIYPIGCWNIQERMRHLIIENKFI